jgi:hypothetical protein
VHEEFSKVVADFADITDFQLEDCDETSRLHSAEVLLVLTLRQGQSAEEVQQLLQGFAQALSQSSVIAEHVDSLRVKLN